MLPELDLAKPDKTRMESVGLFSEMAGEFMKQFVKKYQHAWVLSFGLLYLIWFAYLERTVTKRYHIMHVSLDDYIPFNEYFIIPYLLWFAYVAVAVAYFFFTSKEEYYQLCAYLFCGMIISLIVCSFFHNGTNFRPMIDPDKNLCSWLVAKLYQADTCTNVFPSVHVYNSVCTHVAIRRSQKLRQYGWIRISSFTLMILICLATVFLKQHSVIDGVGAGIMAYALYYAVYGTSERLGDKKAARKAIG